MNEQVEHIDINEFPLKWRFAEDASRWTEFSSNDRLLFQPLSEASSRLLWQRYVAEDSYHLMTCPEEKRRFGSTITAQTVVADDHNHLLESDRVRSFLTQHVNIRNDSNVLFFWGGACAAETKWMIFLRYWDDFCYPSDDTNVVVPLNSDRLIVFVEDHFWIYMR